MLQYIACLNLIQFTYDSRHTIQEIVRWLACDSDGSRPRNFRCNPELYEWLFVERRSMEVNNQKAHDGPNLDLAPNFRPKLKKPCRLAAGGNVLRDDELLLSGNRAGKPPNRQLVPDEKGSTRRNQESRKVCHLSRARSEKLGKALNAA